MAEDLMISHGEPQWDVKYNNLVNTVEQMGGVVNGLQWTPWTKEGLVFLNGFQDIESKYRYVTLGNVKLVEILVSVKLMTAPSDHQPTAVQLPASISDEIQYEYSESPKYGWIINGTEFHPTLHAGADWWTGNDSHYWGHLVYTHTN